MYVITLTIWGRVFFFRRRFLAFFSVKNPTTSSFLVFPRPIKSLFVCQDKIPELTRGKVDLIKKIFIEEHNLDYLCDSAEEGDPIFSNQGKYTKNNFYIALICIICLLVYLYFHILVWLFSSRSTAPTH